MPRSRLIWLLCMAGLSSATVEGSESCTTLFATLNTEHTRAVETTLAASPEQRAQLAAIESSLFTALERCPANANLYALMGEVQISMGQVPLAVVYGREAVKLEQNSWRAQQLLGSALAMLGKTRRGIAHLEQAVALAPDQPRLRVNLASALFADEEYERVLQICDELIDSPDTRAAGAAYNLRGQVYLQLGELKKAGHDFDAAIRLGFDPRRQLHDTEKWRRYYGEDPEGLSH